MVVVVVVDTEQRIGSKPKRDETRREEGEEEGVTDGEREERERVRQRERAEAERAAQHALHRTAPHALHPFHRPFLPTQRSAPLPKVQQQQQSSSPAAQQHQKKGGGGFKARVVESNLQSVGPALCARVPLFRAKARFASAPCELQLRGRPTRFSTRDALGSCAHLSPAAVRSSF